MLQPSRTWTHSQLREILGGVQEDRLQWCFAVEREWRNVCLEEQEVVRHIATVSRPPAMCDHLELTHSIRVQWRMRYIETQVRPIRIKPEKRAGSS